MTQVMLGEGWARPVTNAPVPRPEDDLLANVLLAVQALQATFAQMPVPQVHLEPSDFTDIVTAVQDLKGPNGPSAEDIALAVREVLVPALTPQPPAPDLAGKKMLEVLERLDFRMKGQIISGGPGAVKVNNTASDPIPVDTGFTKSLVNSTTATLLAGARFTGAWEPITSYEQVTAVLYGEPSTFQSIGTSAPGTLLAEFSSDGGTTTDVFLPIEVPDPGYFIPYPLIPVGTHYRVSYLNDGGVLAGGSGTPANLTKLRLSSLLHKVATKEITRTLAQAVDDNQPVVLGRSVQMGRDPDDNYNNAHIGGTRTLSPATSVLGTSGVYTSGWMDSEQYPSVRLLVATDQASADSGIVLQWSDTSTGVTVRTTERSTFRTAHITDGLLVQTVTRARYVRIVYTNGLTPQSRFFLNFRMSPYLVAPTVDLKSASGAQTGQQDVTLTATALPTALANRKGIRLNNLSSSARALFFGFTSGVTTSSGDELAAGASVDLDLDDGVTVYVITTSTGGAGVRCSYTEIA